MAISRRRREEHEGRLPQPGVPAGPRNTPPLASTHETGGTSGDLSIPDYVPETPVDWSSYVNYGSAGNDNLPSAIAAKGVTPNKAVEHKNLEEAARKRAEALGNALGMVIPTATGGASGILGFLNAATPSQENPTADENVGTQSNAADILAGIRSEAKSAQEELESAANRKAAQEPATGNPATDIISSQPRQREAPTDAKQPEHLTVQEAAKILEEQGARPNVALTGAQRMGQDQRDELLAAVNQGYGQGKSTDRSTPQRTPQENHAVADQVNSIGEGWGLDAQKVGALVRAGRAYGVSPALLASIGKIESGNGTSTLPGVHSGVNEAGAAGPFQIGNGEGSALAGDWWHEHMPEDKNIYDYNDASMAAAKYLSDAGATDDPSTWYNAALSYNHADWYAQEVTENAEAAAQANWGGAGPARVGHDNPTQEPAAQATEVHRPSEVRTAGDVIPQPKLKKWFTPSPGTSGDWENILNLNPVLARHLIQVAAEYGHPLDINSAQRSVQEQEEIDPGTNPKAPPGLSAHQFGMAADIEEGPSLEEYERHGLEHGEGGAGVADPPHTELVDPRLIEAAAKYGPVRSDYLPAGMPNVEGDLEHWTVNGESAGFIPYSGGGGESFEAPAPSYGGSPTSSDVLSAALDATAPSGATSLPAPEETAKPSILDTIKSIFGEQDTTNPAFSLLNAPIPGQETDELSNDELLELILKGRGLA